jgi:hypothetical protein
MFRYDPIAEPSARLRLVYDRDDGMAVLYEEGVPPEHAHRPDVEHKTRVTRARACLETNEVRWLATQLAELATIMERDELDGAGDTNALDGIPQSTPVPCEEIILRGVDDRFDKGGACE